MKHGLVRLKVYLGAWVASQEGFQPEAIVLNTSALKCIEPFPLPDSRAKSEIKVGKDSYYSELSPDQLWDELERQLSETSNQAVVRRYIEKKKAAHPS